MLVRNVGTTEKRSPLKNIIDTRNLIRVTSIPITTVTTVNIQAATTNQTAITHLRSFHILHVSLPVNCTTTTNIRLKVLVTSIASTHLSNKVVLPQTNLISKRSKITKLKTQSQFFEIAVALPKTHIGAV